MTSPSYRSRGCRGLCAVAALAWAGPAAAQIVCDNGFADTNLDAAVDRDDLDFVVANWGEAAFDPAADLNGDGAVDVLDLILIVESWGPVVPCDVILVCDGENGTIPLGEVRNDLGAHYLQVCDIVLPAVQNFPPIGTAEAPFQGTYEGDHHTITNLYQAYLGDSNIGLFGGTLGATIRNLHLVNVYVVASARAGGLVGHSRGDVVRNVSVTGYVEGISEVGGVLGYAGNTDLAEAWSAVEIPVPPIADESFYFGGIVGYMGGGFLVNAHSDSSVRAYYGGGGVAGYVHDGGVVSGCTASGDVGAVLFAGGLVGLLRAGSVLEDSLANVLTMTISPDGADIEGMIIGGLVGQLEASTVRGCLAQGDVVATIKHETLNQSAGGLVGRVEGGGLIEDCHATGDVQGTDEVGGLVGSAHGGLVVRRCSARGDVSASFADGGGFVGLLAGGTIEESLATGDVAVQGHHAGGFVGRTAPSSVATNVVDSAYALGGVLGQTQAGGFVGESAVPGDMIRDCYAAGAVVTAFPGGFAGHVGGPIAGSFWDTVTSGVPVACPFVACGGATGLPTEQLQQKATFEAVGWVFVDEGDPEGTGRWTMVDGGYPALWWE